MEISKRIIPKGHDRLSELPNSLIFHILWFVPFHDAVKTTILSKHWRNLWTTTPFLNFESKCISDKKSENFKSFVGRALLRWNGNKILKFKLDASYEKIDDNMYGDMELWANFAKDKGVEELYLHLVEKAFDYGDHEDQGPFMVPPCLYSCSSLKVLSFKYCNFQLYADVQWNQLKSLTITHGFGVTEHVLNQILLGSPRLEVLNLGFVDRRESLSIRSHSLKELLIRRFLLDDLYLCFVPELTIWTPNLETLTIEGMPFGNCQLMNISSLTCATIRFHCLVYDQFAHIDCGRPWSDINDENGGFLSTQDYIGDKCSQSLQTIQHVESITLSFCCLKVLTDMKMRCKHSSFRNVKSLKIDGFDANYDHLLRLLESFPQLERLALKANRGYEYSKPDPKPVVKYETNIPSSFLLQLRTIDITWKHGDNIIALIEFLLKHASKLEKMVFRVGCYRSPHSLLSTSTKLLNTPRSSTKCRIVFQQYRRGTHRILTHKDAT